MNLIRLGLVGCGRISQFHLAAISELPQYKLTAVCDEVRARAEETSQKFGGQVFDSLPALLASHLVDLVVLCTPSGLHALQAAQCAEAGTACLSEKPFGVNFSESQAVVELFHQKNVPLFVVFQNRFNPTIAQLRSCFDQGLLGKPYLIQANVYWQRPQSYYDDAPWRGTRTLDGGAFMNQASHYVDLVSWFGGEPVSVEAEVSTLARKIECEDTGAAVIRFANGSIGTIAVCMLTYPENWEGSLTLICEKATIKIGGKALNKIEECRAENPEVKKLLEETTYEPKTVYGNGHSAYYKQLASDWFEGKAGPVTGRESLKSLELLCRFYGQKVEVKERSL